MTNSSNRCACGGLRHKHDVEEIEQLRGNLSQMEVQRDHWLQIAREKDVEIEELKRWQLEARKLMNSPASEPEASHYCIDCNEAHDPRTCGALKSGEQS